MYLSDGRKFYGTVSTGSSFFTGIAPIVVDECEMLDESSMRLVFHTENETMTFFFPGQHVSLALPSDSWQPLCREYSPIVTEAYGMSGRIQVWIRLHPQGKMSQVLREYSSSFNEIPKFTELNDIGVNPMASGGQVKNSSTDTESPQASKWRSCPLMVSVSSSRLNYYPSKYRGLLLIATGTGLAPYLNLINYIVNNQEDRTSIYLIFITNGDKFGVDAINSINGRSKLTVDIRQTKPRFGVADVEKVVVSKINDGTFGGHHDLFSFQIHINGSPAFVKALDRSVRNSQAIPLIQSDQVVSWGYSDR